MAAFFVNRPIVAMVIAILMSIVGLVSMLGLPVAQYPDIVPTEIAVTASYTGADAITVEQSVATPIEQMMSGVDNMNYMVSTNSNSGVMSLRVNFDLASDPNTDQILTQMRVAQAEPQLPTEVRATGVTVTKSNASPLLLFSLSSPNGTYDSTFLSNYAYINLSDALTRVKGIASVNIFGAGPYAMRIWVLPDRLAKLSITIPEIIGAIQSQNTVNPAGTIGGEPVPPGQAFTYSVAAQGRLATEAEFGDIVIRANPDGSMVRVRDVARVELGSNSYSIRARFDGKPTAALALYQTPGTNALEAARGARAMMAELAQRFPNDLEYDVALDTTLAVSEGVNEIVHTLFEALVLVILVVFMFLQGWRPTLIPLLAVPVSLLGTFAFFPLFGFSINTLSLFGMVLAIGLVVDDAIVVVEAVEHHIKKGLSPREATLKAMSEVTGPVIATALILAAVFVPTVFIPGITGQLYQQFAITIAVSILLSAFNALTLSPALSAILLRPKSGKGGLLTPFYRAFNQGFGRLTRGYVGVCRFLIRKLLVTGMFLLLAVAGAGFFGKNLPSAFIPNEDQGYAFAGIELPQAASLQRTDAAARSVEEALMAIPGVAHVTSVVGYNLLSSVTTSYNAFFFITLEPWEHRQSKETSYAAITRAMNRVLSSQPGFIGFAFPPPAIPGVGTAGGVTFVLQDRSGGDVNFLADNMKTFIAAARQRPEIANVLSTWSYAVPQVFVDVDRDKVLKQELDVKDVYQTLQCFMGGVFVNFFNRFGRQWQVFVQADGAYRTDPADITHFYVKNRSGHSVPLDSVASLSTSFGPEFTLRFNLYRSVQLNVSGAPGVSSGEVMAALEETFRETMPPEMGFEYLGMSFQEKKAAEGVPPAAIFALSLLFVFLILAAQYESWSLPFSVLLGTPVAVMGALGGLWSMRFLSPIYENNIYAQIGLVMLIGLAAKNAILIVEFCKVRVEEGMELMAAALEGAELRFRPILMTAFAFILGCVPLATASGSGAVSRQVMGMTVIGGMMAASFIGILIVPALFYAVEKLVQRRSEKPVVGTGLVPPGAPETTPPEPVAPPPQPPSPPVPAVEKPLSPVQAAPTAAASVPPPVSPATPLTPRLSVTMGPAAPESPYRTSRPSGPGDTIPMRIQPPPPPPPGPPKPFPRQAPGP